MDMNEKNLPENAPKVSMEKKDLLASMVLIVFGLYLLGTGVYMSLTTMALSDSPWYGTPGMFPIFIGAVLTLFSSIMMISLLRAGVRIDRTTADAAKLYFKGKRFRRMLVAIGFLAIYIFVLFGRINFALATFLYLFCTILYFRENKFAVWKIFLISAGFTGFLYLFFGVLAGIPLP